MIVAGPKYDVLLLDFGGVCLLNPVELHHKAESRLGIDAGVLDWLGPIDPDSDPLWREMISGRSITERDYWRQRAIDVGAAANKELEVHEYMTLLYDPPTPDIIRQAASATAIAAKAAGYGVSVFTNDMSAFHGKAWQQNVEFLDLMDHIVDCSDTNILKPDQRSYQRAVEILGVAPSRILFVDDQPRNVQGALDCGLDAMEFDVANADDAWAAVAARLDLPTIATCA